MNKYLATTLLLSTCPFLVLAQAAPTPKSAAEAAVDATAIASQSENWELIIGEREAYTFVDTNSIEEEEFWEITYYQKNDFVTEGRIVEYQIVKIKYDCSSKSSAFGAYATYDRQSSLISSGDLSSYSQLEQTFPGTRGRSELDFICGVQNGFIQKELGFPESQYALTYARQEFPHAIPRRASAPKTKAKAKARRN